MQMWPFDARQMTDDHVLSWNHKAAMKHMDITAVDFCQVSWGGWGCLACWGLDQTDVPSLQGEPRQALQTLPFGIEGPDHSGHNPLLAIALRYQLILCKDLEAKSEPSPWWKLPCQNLAVSVMLNVDQKEPGFQKDLVQKLGAFVSHKMPSVAQKYPAKEDKTVGLEGIEDWYKKICKALFFFIPRWSTGRCKASGWLAELHGVLLKCVKWSGANPCLLSYDSEMSRSPVGKMTSTCSKSVLPKPSVPLSTQCRGPIWKHWNVGE